MTKLFSLLSNKEIHLSPGKKSISAEEFSKLLSVEDLLATIEEERKDLQDEMEIEREKKKEEGFQEGVSEGLASLNQHVLSLDRAIKNLRNDLQENILSLSLIAAKKIVGEEISLHPERIADIILTAIKPITQHKKIILYVNREDLPMIEEKKGLLKEAFEHLESLSIQERSDIEKGGCIIETEAGIINAQLENQWRALESAFASFKH